MIDVPTLLDQLGSNVSKDNLLKLQADARTIIIAGSDTVAAILSHIFYVLGTHLEHMVKLREELQQLIYSDGKFEHQKIHQADHLNAIINETLRLYPVPPTTITRKTLPEGITIEGTWIPGNMHVWTPQYVIWRSSDAFEKPYEFIPERWYSRPSRIKDVLWLAPFLIGPYRCIGRPLALMELRTVIAEIVVRFDIAFPPGKDGSEFIMNVKDRFTWGLPDLNICFHAPEEKIGEES